MLKSFYNNASGQKQNVDGQCNDNKSSNRGERYQYAEQSCINDKRKKLFLLDIDGTVALGSKLLPGAADFLQTVKENGGIFRFLTNNSSKAASDYVEQFHGWGIETTEEEFITAGTMPEIHEEILRKRKIWWQLLKPTVANCEKQV